LGCRESTMRNAPFSRRGLQEGRRVNAELGRGADFGDKSARFESGRGLPHSTTLRECEQQPVDADGGIGRKLVRPFRARGTWGVGPRALPSA